MLVDRAEHGLQYELQTFPLGSEWYIESARRGRDRLQFILVEVRLHERAGLVLDIPSALIHRQRNEISGCGSDADRIDFQMILLRRIPCRRHRAALEVFTVGHEYQDLVRTGATVQGTLR